MKTHTVNLTNAAARELVTIATVRGLLSGKSRQRVLASKFVRAQVLRRGVPEAPTDNAAVLDWSEARFAQVENVTEVERDALKALVRDADAKGILDCGAGGCDLLEELGLSEQDAAPAPGG